MEKKRDLYTTTRSLIAPILLGLAISRPRGLCATADPMRGFCQVQDFRDVEPGTRLDRLPALSSVAGAGDFCSTIWVGGGAVTIFAARPHQREFKLMERSCERRLANRDHRAARRALANVVKAPILSSISVPFRLLFHNRNKGVACRQSETYLRKTKREH